MSDTTPPPARPNLGDEAWLSLQRAAASDFQRTKATDAERGRLAQAVPPLTEETAQDYAGWRKSILYLASLLLVLAAAFVVVDYKSIESAFVESAQESNPHLSEDQARQQVRQQFGASNLETLDLLPLLNLIALLLTTLLTVLAARAWVDVRRSRRLARTAWFVLLGVPLALAVVPWVGFLDMSHLQEQQAQALTMLLGLALGLEMVIGLGPKLLALLPGVLRASLTLKTLLPETSLPGWVAACAAPFYVMLLILVLAPLNQWRGDALLFFGVVALLIGGLIYLRHVRALARPCDGKTASEVVARARRQALLWNGLGLLLVLVFLFQLDIVTWNVGVAFLATAAGSLFLMTVVSCDFLLAVLDISFHQGQALYESEDAKQLDDRLAALGASGLTGLRTAEAKAEAPTASE